MKVSFKQLTGILKLMASLGNSDELLDEESESIILFLRGFNIDNEKKRELLCGAVEMDIEEATDIVTGLDQTTKQEVSNLLFDLIMVDGVVSDPEAEMFMSLMADCDFPVPNTQVWSDWLASSNESEEEMLSNEPTAASDGNIACYYVIEPAGDDDYFMGKCWAYSDVNNRPVSDEAIARNLLRCTKGTLLVWKQLPVLDAVAKDLEVSEVGVFRAYIAKSPANYVENKAASKLCGRKIYGACLIRFVSNDGKYLELVESYCEQLHRSLRTHLDCPMTYNTKPISL